MEPEVQHRMVATNGVRLHVAEAGPADGPLLILLHGFPELWYGWKEQIGPLAGAGFRVLVPDQRGYARSDKPKGVHAYNLDALALDVVGLIRDAGRERASVVGHDWGGVVAWWLGLKHPDRLEKLAILNSPHPWVMRRALRRDWAQRRRSWYMFFDQIPWLPELAMSFGDFRVLVRALRSSSRPGTFSDEDLKVYKEAWSQPGAMTGMLSWYRAMYRARPERPRSPRVTVPTLLIWGAGDRFLGRELAQPSIELCDHGRLAFIDEASHWVQHEEPDRVNALLADFLG
jgi:pimeloyl-ACP methyl ester carboxylesterase